MQNEQEIMMLIVHGGNGRSSAMEAIRAAKAGDTTKANKLIQEASIALNEAHNIQTSLIQKEISGEKAEISLLMVHAQDHLMNAMTVKDLAAEIVEIHAKCK